MKRQHPEDNMQIALFTWAALEEMRYPDLHWMYHCPNGGNRSEKEAARLKAAGVKAGVSDVCLPAPRGGYHGLYIELKVKPNVPTQKQQEFLMAMSRYGYRTAVCYTLDEAIREITMYLKFRGLKE